MGFSGFCEECPDEDPDWGALVGLVILALIGIGLIGFVAMKSVARYNFKALGLVMGMQKKEQAVFFSDDMTPQKRHEYLCELQLAQKYGTETRDALMVLPSHDAREAFLHKEKDEREAFIRQLTITMHAIREIEQVRAAAAQDSVPGVNANPDEEDEEEGEGEGAAAEEDEAPEVGGADEGNAPAEAPAEAPAPSGEMGMGDRNPLSGIREQSKITLSLMQVSSSWTQNFDIPWPKELTEFLNRIQVVNIKLMSFQAIACANEPNAANSFLLMAFLPLVFTAVLLFFHLPAKLLGKMKSSLGSTPVVLKIFFVVIFLIFPATCNAVLKIVAPCEKFADGSEWLRADYSIGCNPDFPVKTLGGVIQFGNLKSLAWVFVFLYVVGIPLSLGVQLYRIRHRLFLPQDPNKPVIRDGDGDIVLEPDPETAKTYGALYVAYSQRFYLWEVFELIRKLCLTGLVIFIAPGTPLQFVIGCLMSLMFAVSYSQFKPYLYSEDDTLQLICQLSIFCTMYAGLLIKSGVSESREFGDGRLFSYILLFLSVTPMVLGVGKMFLTVKSSLWKATQKVKKKGDVLTRLKQPGAAVRLRRCQHVSPELLQHFGYNLYKL
eukprot:g4096.t1